MNNVFCQYKPCGKRIDDAKLIRAGSKGQRYCSKACMNKARKEAGFFFHMGKTGNAAQANIKKQQGKVPGVRGGARPGAGKRKAV